MIDIMQIQRQIKEYIISSNRFNILEKNIGVELTKIGGYSNMNYRGIIKDISTNKIIEEVFYRKFGSKFGEFSESVNHEIENFITKYLAQRGYGPKLLYEVPNDYTISEYLIDTITLPIEKYFDQNIIKQLCNILSHFTFISYTYKYKINDNNISITKVEDDIKEKKISLNKNIFEKGLSMLENTKHAFDVFINEFKRKYSKEKNEKEWADVELVQNHVNNFKKYFIDSFPSQGFFVINHNDVHRQNILFREKEQKIFLIDHEYFFLNLPGFDIVYYLVEYYINYEPEYFCSLNKVDFDKTFIYYEKFINLFIQHNKLIEKEEGGKDFIEIIKTKKYYIYLTNLVNLYLFIWSIGNAKFEAWDKNHKSEFFFVHGVDRIKFYLTGMNAIEQL